MFNNQKIKFENVSLRYNKKNEILNELNFTIKNSKITQIVGPSGIGKTTILNAIINNIIPYKGKIINDFSKDEICYIAQNDSLLNNLSIIDNIVLGKKWKTEKIRKQIKKIINKLGIDKSIFTKVNELSGGQKTRIFLARAIFVKSKLIILDEPFIGLDQKIKLEIIKYLKNEFINHTMIIVTHDDCVKKIIDEKIKII